MSRYHVFHRTWWRKAIPCEPEDRGYPKGLVPCPGIKWTIETVDTIEEAREMCREYNSTHDKGELSDKAEFEDMDD